MSWFVGNRCSSCHSSETVHPPTPVVPLWTTGSLQSLRHRTRRHYPTDLGPNSSSDTQATSFPTRETGIPNQEDGTGTNSSWHDWSEFLAGIRSVGKQWRVADIATCPMEHTRWVPIYEGGPDKPGSGQRCSRAGCERHPGLRKHC